MANAEHSSNAFRATDPEMPFLAAQAALELDLLAKNKPRGLEHVEKLADMLASISEAGGNYSDPVSTGVLSRALTGFFASGPETLSDYGTRRREIAEILQHVADGDKEPRIEQLRDFCLSVSRFSSTSQTDLYGNRQRHPFRK